MNAVLDHVIVFVEQEGPPAAALEEAGFRVLPRHEHPDQGTANRSVLFADSYLDLLFLSSREEAARNPLLLERRADWRRTGASPFGFGLRGEMSEEAKESHRPYFAPCAEAARPPLWFITASRDDARLPLLNPMCGGYDRRTCAVSEPLESGERVRIPSLRRFEAPVRT